MKRIQAGFSRQASIGKQTVWTCACVLSLLLACFPTLHASAETLHWTGSVDTNWFTAGNWEPAGPPQENDTAIVNAGTSVSLTNATPPLAAFVLGAGKTLTISGWESALDAQELTIAGTVTHAMNMTSTTNSLGEWIPEHRVLIRGSNLTITANGLINTDACGYRGGEKYPGYGPGRGLYAFSGANLYGGGASHGGLAGNGHSTAFGGPIYGSVENPRQPGSGGGNNGGAGGGAVRIELNGALQVDGEIRACAGTGTSGGSGGSIAVDCNTFDGAGWLRANGSNGSGNSGSGGGGRIAMHFNGAAQSTLETSSPGFEAMGSNIGKWYHAEALRDYAMGTIYLSDAGFFRHGWPSWNGWLYLPTNRLDVTGDLMLANLHTAFATVRRIDVGGNLTLANGGKLFLVGAPTATNTLPGAELNVTGDILIQSGGVLYPRSHPTNGASVRIQAANLTVNTGGAIDANGRGYRGGSIRQADDPDGATGLGYGPSQPTIGFVASSGAIYGGGASYGGLGGDGHTSTCLRGLRYGTPDKVVEPGSGGAGHSAGGGGGLIWIEVDEHVRVDGELRVNGGSYAITGTLGSGGGSGGGVSITCRTLDGSGRILANGGSGDNGGVGGGGRIALHYDPAFQATVTPPKLYCELVSGTSGVFKRSAAPYEARIGTLWVPDLLLIGTNWNNWSGWLHLPTNHIHVAGDLSVTRGWAALATVQTLEIDGGLVLGGSGSLCLDPLPTTAVSIPGARIDIVRDLTINNGGALYVRSHPTNGAPLKVTARNVTVAAGGLICGDERGYFGREQPWPAYGPGAGTQDSTTHGSGAGYGGVGGYGYPGNPGGVAYGRALAPLEPGSGGGGDYYGGHGGATVWIETPGQLRIDGTISANGGAPRASYSGSGSGGGILLNARTIMGASTGIIRADGADGNVYGGGGAGGRIACWRRISPELAMQLITGAVTNFAEDTISTMYQGMTSAIGGTGYTHATNLTYPQKAGDGTVVWLSPHYTLFQIR